MNVAIITARGGSKRIPRKNIREFCGKPIMAYSIEAALNSGIFDEVMVSTDDEEIAGIAKKLGASIPFMRSAKNSDDHAMTADVLIEVVQEYEKRGRFFDMLGCIYPTAPFITAEKLRKGLETIQSLNADALVPVVKFSYPPQRCFVMDGTRIRYKWSENTFVRSQDLEPYYHDVGQYYFIKTKVLMEAGTLVPENTIPFIVDEMEVQDIDNIDDWHIAEIKYRAMIEAQHDNI